MIFTLFNFLLAGGPVLLEEDQTLIGVTKSTVYQHNIPVQKIMKISYFFDWISSITGMVLPECGEQAPLFTS